MNIAILVMAAGFSRRFRASGGEHKLLTMLNGKPVLQHTLAQVAATGLDYFVVTRPQEVQTAALVPDGRAVFCNSAGIGESIAAGVGASADYDGWLITLGDMPLLSCASLRAVADALQEAPLARAVVNGEPGHPVGFRREFYPALSTLRGDTGAREVLRRAPCRMVHLADRGCVLDIDTLADVARLQHCMAEDAAR